MPEIPEEELLTLEARSFLNRLLADIRFAIISQARNEKAATGKDDLISSSDVARAANKIGIVGKETEIQHVVDEHRRFRINVTTVALGASVLVVAGAGVAANYLATADKLASILGLVSAVAGLLIAFLAILATKSSRIAVREAMAASTDALDEAEFLRHWVELEKAIRDRVAREKGRDRAIQPLRTVLFDYAQIVDMPISEFDELREILRARNAAIHSLPGEINIDSIRKLQPRIVYHLRRAQGASSATT